MAAPFRSTRFFQTSAKAMSRNLIRIWIVKFEAVHSTRMAARRLPTTPSHPTRRDATTLWLPHSSASGCGDQADPARKRRLVEAACVLSLLRGFCRPGLLIVSGQRRARPFNESVIFMLPLICEHRHRI
jgi:hypothetical protein